MEIGYKEVKSLKKVLDKTTFKRWELTIMATAIWHSELDQMIWLRITDHLGNFGLSHSTKIEYTIPEGEKSTILKALDMYLDRNYKAEILTAKRSNKKKR